MTSKTTCRHRLDRPYFIVPFVAQTMQLQINYRSFTIISGFMTHVCSVTHVDSQVKLFEQTQQKIMEMYREVLSRLR